MKRKPSKKPENWVVTFPDPDTADPDSGLLAVGADFQVPILVQAYRQGIFPWPMPVGELTAEEAPPLWFCPAERALLFFDEVHIPRSLAKARRQSPLRFTVDLAFEEVITACSEAPRPGQDGTWITTRMREAYIELHRAGHAHSFEAWRGDRLVAGLYGVDAGGAFAGESMFHREDNASKLVILHAIEHLAARGARWLDIQVLTPHMERLGAREIPRAEYLSLLKQTQAQGLILFSK
jgi:leucyl/phenylalanyl-tRNA--protein transferase